MLQAQKGRWNPSDSNGGWRKLWQIKVPPKVTHVCWRALTDCLPTMSMLYSRYVPVQLNCPVCNAGEETIGHALVSCSFATACWNKVLGNRFLGLVTSFKDWFFQIVNSVNKEKREEILMTCWALWKARNELVWQKKRSLVENVISSTRSYFVQ